MGARGMFLGGAVAAALIAGCGGSGKSTTTHVSSTATTAAAAKPRTGLERRVLTNNELPGFTAQPPTIERDPRLYLAGGNESGSQLASDTARLKRLGFKGAASENLSAQGQAGLSLVEQLGSAAAARSELATAVQQSKSLGGKFATFSVSGIPGAVGYSLSSPQGDGINITWAQGPYYYEVGETVSSLNRSSERTLDAAARHLYQRVSG